MIYNSSAIWKPPQGIGLEPRNQLARGAVLFMPFNEGTGLNVGNAANPLLKGTLNSGVSWVGGTFGPCLSFNGSTGYVNCTSNATLNPATAITIACWVYFNSIASASTFIGRDDNALGRAYSFGWSSGNGFNLQISGSVKISDSDTSPTLGRWYHIAVTGSATGTVLNLYRNGVRVANNTSWVNFNTTTGATTLGERTYSGSQQYFNGYMDAPFIANRLLTSAEIQALYANSWQVMQSPETYYLDYLGTVPYAFSAAGLAISGGYGGTGETVTVLLAGLGISGAWGGATGEAGLGPFYLPYEYTSTVIETGNANPFGIDPEQSVSILTGNMDPFGIDPEQTVVLAANAGTGESKRELEDVPAHRLLENLTSYRLLEGSGTGGDPFEIDPEQTTLITVGLTSSD